MATIAVIGLGARNARTTFGAPARSLCAMTAPAAAAAPRRDASSIQNIFTRPSRTAPPSRGSNR